MTGARAEAVRAGADGKKRRRRRAAKVVRHPAYATVERTIVERNEELLQCYGAHHIGISKKYRKGERLPQTCITFYVPKKGKDVSARQIPKHLSLIYGDGSTGSLIATDVCEIGEEEPVAFAMRGGDLVIANGQTGTVGLVFEQGQDDFFLTNAHVVAPPGGPLNTVSVRTSTGQTIRGPIARTDSLNPLSVISSDAALVSVPNNSVAPGQFRGVNLVLDICGDIAMNDPRRFFYVAANFVHEVRWRAFMPAATKIVVHGQSFRYAGFHKFGVVVGQCRPGHSGAVVFCQSANGLNAVGLLFGGHQSTNEVWVFPIRPALVRMGVNPDSI